MLGWIVLAVVLVGAAFLFVLQSQNGNSRGQMAALMLGGAGVSLVAFFLLPWISIGIGGSDMFSSFIPSEVTSVVEQEFRRALQDELLVTGWKLAAESPLADMGFQFSLFLVAISAVVGLVVGGLGLNDHPLVQPGGLFTLVLSVLGIILLFMMLRRIRAFGMDPGIFTPLFEAVKLGPGVWLSFVGMALMAASGGMVAQMSATSGKSKAKGRSRSRIQSRRRR